MAKIIRMTMILLVITVLSKLIGFIRELTLLEVIGISAELDIFLALFGISGVIMSIVGISIMTNLTPIAHARNTPDQVLEILLEGIKVGAALTCLSWAISTGYLETFAAQTSASPVATSLCMIIPLVVFFAIIAEYQAAILLGRNNQTAVISGNIILSAPLIFLMLIADVTIISYAIGLVTSFALRTFIFMIIIYRPPSSLFSWWAALVRPSVLRRDFITIAAGGSAMTAMNLLFLGCLLIAQNMGEGQASYFGYGMKVPMLVLTSVWFVFGSRFFSQIVADRGANARQKILKLSGLNVAMALGVAACVLILISLDNWIATLPVIGESVFLNIFQDSIPFLPLIVFVPIVEMLQRTLVTIKRPWDVLHIALAISAAGCIGLSIAWALSSATILVLAMSGTTCIGAVVALIKLRDKTFDPMPPLEVKDV
jgi:hypothetical protein